MAVSITCLLLLGCSQLQHHQQDETVLAYSHWSQDKPHSAYAPIIVPQNPQAEYNRIGTATARYGAEGEEQIYIDTNQATFYTQSRTFETANGRYANLLYRFHFTEVPQRHLTSGENVGLFVIITLDQDEHPILITTVHTCGCYLAFLPTNYLPDDALPEDWPAKSQRVYGETLPSRLDYPNEFHTQLRPLIHLRDRTHRVMDVQLANIDSFRANVRLEAQQQSMPDLERLTLGDKTTSFFHTEGSNKGYVKGSSKPWERLLMSWWSLDWRVGVDKALGPANETGTVFYTSLKPWARKASDMEDFASFLGYWGWRL